MFSDERDAVLYAWLRQNRNDNDPLPSFPRPAPTLQVQHASAALVQTGLGSGAILARDHRDGPENRGGESAGRKNRGDGKSYSALMAMRITNQGGGAYGGVTLASVGGIGFVRAFDKLHHRYWN